MSGAAIHGLVLLLLLLLLNERLRSSEAISSCIEAHIYFIIGHGEV